MLSRTIKNTAIRVPLGAFINGRMCVSDSNDTTVLINPVDRSELCRVPNASAEDVDLAVQGARDALSSGSEWSSMTARERGAVLARLADLVHQHSQELATIESLNTGITLEETLTSHLPATVDTLRYYAGWADKFAGSLPPATTANYLTYVDHVPLGVCGAILPWNYPLLLASWKIGPALATGNAVVLKPSELTPLTALRLAELSLLAGVPAGVLQVLPGTGAVAGNALARHMDVDKIAFTGSEPTGRRIMQSAAESNLKKVSLELGGKSPLIVCDDVDIDFAARWVDSALFSNAGQNCCAASRVLVDERIYEQFVARLVELVGTRKIGDPFDESVQQGPVVDARQYAKVCQMMEAAHREGVPCALGGATELARAQREHTGFQVPPTIFTHVPDTAAIGRDEVFGPILSIMTPFSSFDSAIARANTSPFGLAAGVLTHDLTRALTAAHTLRAGTVWVNSYNMSDPSLPFGGFRRSGIGRDLGQDALNNYTESRAVVINFGAHVP